MLGYARGKVGSLVFARRSGEQVTRAYNSNPANPKSTAQMLQRMKWANLVSFYKAVSPKLKMAFEDKKENQSDFNAFMAANLGKTAVYLTKQQVQNGASVISPYIVSRGSLFSLGMTRVVENGSVRLGFAVDFGFESSSSLDSATAEEVLTSIQNVNPNYDFRYGDQITFFVAMQANAPHVALVSAKVVLGIHSGAEINSILTAAGLTFGNSIMINTPADIAIAATAIHSRYEGGKLLTSTAQLIMSVEPAQLFSDLALPTFDAAARSYGWTDQAYLNPSDEIALATEGGV